MKRRTIAGTEPVEHKVYVEDACAVVNTGGEEACAVFSLLLPPSTLRAAHLCLVTVPSPLDVVTIRAMRRRRACQSAAI